MNNQIYSRIYLTDYFRPAPNIGTIFLYFLSEVAFHNYCHSFLNWPRKLLPFFRRQGWLWRCLHDNIYKCKVSNDEKENKKKCHFIGAVQWFESKSIVFLKKLRKGKERKKQKLFFILFSPTLREHVLFICIDHNTVFLTAQFI